MKKFTVRKFLKSKRVWTKTFLVPVWMSDVAAFAHVLPHLDVSPRSWATLRFDSEGGVTRVHSDSSVGFLQF